jgi:hypothetical protein
MTGKPHRAILEDDVFALTPKAQHELHGSATSLAPAALEVLVKAVKVVLGLVEGGRMVEAKRDPWLSLGRPPK